MTPASLPSSARRMRVARPPWREKHSAPTRRRQGLQQQMLRRPGHTSAEGHRLRPEDVDETGRALRQLLHIGAADGKGRLVPRLCRQKGRPGRPTPPASSARRQRALSGWAAMAASVRRISAVAEAYCSQQPLRPQGQGSPPAWSTMCPASLEDSPPRRRPSRMIPAPRPVPRVSTTKSRRPRPAPWKYSPTAAQSASLPSSTGRSSRRRNKAARSVRSRGMLVVYSTSPPETAPAGRCPRPPRPRAPLRRWRAPPPPDPPGPPQRSPPPGSPGGGAPPPEGGPSRPSGPPSGWCRPRRYR